MYRTVKYFLRIISTGVLLIFVSGSVVIVSAYVYQFLEKPEYVNEHISLKNELKIPPLLDFRKENGKMLFSGLILQEGQTEFFEGFPTSTWGINGTYLGPTIRAHRDDIVRLNVKNELPEDTTVHWHGMHVPAEMDGGPHQVIKPGTTWEVEYQIKQEAATLWYHPHPHKKTGRQLYNGLSGIFIIEDENSDKLDIPREYGVDDVPVVVQDKEFTDEKQLIYDAHREDWMGHKGMLGDEILVNGTHAPFVTVPGKQVRLRILNASNARRYNFGFSDNRTFQQIASDGGFLEEPVELTRVVLSPGERAEIIVDVSDLKKAVLLSYAVIEDENTIQNLVEGIFSMEKDENEIYKILEIRPTKTNNVTSVLPEKLNTIKRWSQNDAVRTRTFSLGKIEIDNEIMDINRINEIVTLGNVELWEFTNFSATYHPIHIHDVQFQILERNGNPPLPNESGWKDTVLVGQDETVRLLMKFKDYSNPTLPYMYHCHILEHEDMGMMGQFVVKDQ